MEHKVDLLYLNGRGSGVDWKLGDVYYASDNAVAIKQEIERILLTTDAEWLVLWDSSFGLPTWQLVELAAKEHRDVYHCGLKQGTAELPDMLNYVHPTWMYNIDGPSDQVHSNFRLSLKACMIKVEVLRKLGLFSTKYKSLRMTGVAYGYQLLKQGAIISNWPVLAENVTKDEEVIPDYDEWVFARQFFQKKWQLWALFNRNGFINNIRQLLATKHVSYISHPPALHGSEKTDEQVTYKTVSILAPTLDRYSYLEAELEELNKQTVLPIEVLITDQTDKNRRQEIDPAKYNNLNIRVFPQDEKGQCIAWNKLISEAKGEYLFFYGDDAYNAKPWFIEKMLQTMQRFDADMVASNVIEKGIKYGTVNHHYYMSDSFPITLIKKKLVERAGGMDMFFNKNVKADHDLAMRCHLDGALMIYDPSAEIGHHRAPSGGLRAHKARVVTNYMAQNTITKVLDPSPSEIFICKKYYSDKQFKNHIRIKYFKQVFIKGNILRKILRCIVLLVKIPGMSKTYRRNKAIALEELSKRKAVK